ncbi:MAG: heme NO-binding domain-containing protein [Myxococcales bacterium]|nr:heme NO-binding domain-containing protein [Myxococcales bacterium]
MYGLINNSLREMTIARWGAEQWTKVASRAGVTDAVFQNMIPYDDALTYALVGALAEERSIDAGALLREFGVFWVRVVAPSQYGDLMQFTGGSLPEFLSNLDRMHDRVATIYQNLEQPSFSVETLSDTRLRLHYRSRRAGLAPFVIGLLEGLGERFATKVSITHQESKSAGANHDVFLVEHGAS